MKRPGLSLAPLDVERWMRIRESGRIGFMLRSGLPMGLALALVFDTVLLTLGGNADLAQSVWRIPRLAFDLATFGPLFGAIGGQAVWEYCERKYSTHLLKEAFRQTDG
jgi:hypothetical protein